MALSPRRHPDGGFGWRGGGDRLFAAWKQSGVVSL